MKIAEKKINLLQWMRVLDKNRIEKECAINVNIPELISPQEYMNLFQIEPETKTIKHL